MLSAADLPGRVLQLCSDQSGCRSLQNLLDTRDPAAVHAVFTEILPALPGILCGEFSNYVIQKLLSACSLAQIRAIVTVSTGAEPGAAASAAASGSAEAASSGDAGTDAAAAAATAAAAAAYFGVPAPTDASLWSLPPFLACCANLHGTRCVQALIDLLAAHSANISIGGSGSGSGGSGGQDQEEQAAAVAALQQLLLQPFLDHPAALFPLACHTNGNHVVSRLLTLLPDSIRSWVAAQLAPRSRDLALHKHGCVILQRCMDAADAPTRGSIISVLQHDAVEFAQHPVANFSVQHVLAKGSQTEVSGLLTRLRGSLVPLACQKCASNVVEKALTVAEPQLRSACILELTGLPSFDLPPTAAAAAAAVDGEVKATDAATSAATVTATAMTADASVNAAATRQLHGLIMDPFANYVVQSLITVSAPGERQAVLAALRPLFPELRNSPGGRRIAARILKHEPQLASELTGVTAAPGDASGRGGPLSDGVASTGGWHGSSSSTGSGGSGSAYGRSGASGSTGGGGRSGFSGGGRSGYGNRNGHGHGGGGGGGGSSGRSGRR